ncbi:unnamed protein product, partial [Rotaria sp. Silwood1]
MILRRSEVHRTTAHSAK